MSHSYFSIKIILVFVLGSCSFFKCFCQGGGPPMMTDDPGTPGAGTWEINISLNSSFNNIMELEAPLIDINYGYKDRTQFKIEIPLQLSKIKNEKLTGNIGNPLAGIKYRILDDNTDSIFISLYPQVSLPLNSDNENEYKLPVQFEKDFRYFTIGEEAGYITNGKGSGEFLNGLLIGTSYIKNWELMAEYYLLSDFKYSNSTKMFINIGFRYEINEKIIIINSFGTQLKGNNLSDRTRFFSFTGVQLLL